MSTMVMWSKSKPDVEFKYGGRLGEFNSMSSQSHVSHCRVLPLGEFTVMFPEPHATLQGVRIPSAILKIVFRHIFLFFLKCSLGFDERRLSYRLRYTCLFLLVVNRRWRRGDWETEYAGNGVCGGCRIEYRKDGAHSDRFCARVYPRLLPGKFQRHHSVHQSDHERRLQRWHRDYRQWLFVTTPGIIVPSFKQKRQYVTSLSNWFEQSLRHHWSRYSSY